MHGQRIYFGIDVVIQRRADIVFPDEPHIEIVPIPPIGEVGDTSGKDPVMIHRERVVQGSGWVLNIVQTDRDVIARQYSV